MQATGYLVHWNYSLTTGTPINMSEQAGGAGEDSVYRMYLDPTASDLTDVHYLSTVQHLKNLLKITRERCCSSKTASC